MTTEIFEDHVGLFTLPNTSALVEQLGLNL